MPSSDPHTGGRLEDMAAQGTTIPNDAGAHRTIPSKPRPDQVNPGSEFSHANPAHAADNAFDIPRSVNDAGVTGEIVTGTGDQITGNIEKKNLDDASGPYAKGHDRYAKHIRQDNPFDRNAAGEHDVQPAPGEEELSQDALLDRRGAK
ncbi:hypothetical protein B0J11DRAFT_584073 [Dendryphion nanum]|uniref:Uncharacterized protein n=1 Tax=Dendryphion nanum TaxID=256645 RepID=A0A9P9DBR5_9PLEO|nr:hypothetical protein B0J11DRAFT_584073 [Dendryphion nanum]